MPAQMIHHVNIACRDLEKTRAFYCDVLGFAVGWRPDIADLPGYWLYLGDLPCLHLCRIEDLGRISPERAAAPGDGTGPIDHVALRCTDADGIKAELEERRIPFVDHETPLDNGIFRQIVLHDPDGIKVELNFEPRPL